MNTDMDKDTISIFQEELSPYIDFDLLDCLNEDQERRRASGRVYLAPLKIENMPEPHMGQDSVILRELFPHQLEVYQKLSTMKNPYLETVFQVLSKEAYALAVNEFIPRPTVLPYSMLTKENAINTRSLTLHQYVQVFGCLSEKSALAFLYELCDGIIELSKNNLVHGDISPGNILLTDRKDRNAHFRYIAGIHQKICVRLIDFDVTKAKKEAEHQVTSVVGTLPYAAPEIMDFKTPSDRVDIYSLGCILYFMLTGHSPKEEDHSKPTENFSDTVAHIFTKCTAGYEFRYKNASQLQKELRKELVYPDKPFFDILRQIPGFRSRNPVKMLFAILCYSGDIFMATVVSEDSLFEGYLCFSYFIMTVILCFDVFGLGDCFPPYRQYREKNPATRYVVRTVIAVFLLMLTAFLLKLVP